MLISSAMKKVQIKNIMHYDCMPFKMSKHVNIIILIIPSAGEDREQMKSSHIPDENAKWYNQK